MKQSILIARVCLYNFLFYAALFTAILKLYPPLLNGGSFALDSHGDVAAVGRHVDFLQVDVKSRLQGQALFEALREGGNVLYVRHFETARSDINDDLFGQQHGRLPAEAFAECAWQRPLSDHGLLTARLVGEIIDSMDIPIQAVHASPYCRTVESAREMFQREPAIDLGLIYRAESYPEEAANRYLLENYLSEPIPMGTNVAVIAHRPPMDSLGGIEEGETVVLQRNEAGLTLVGRIQALNWILATQDLAELGDPNVRDTRRRSLPGLGAAPPREAFPEIEVMLRAAR